MASTTWKRSPNYSAGRGGKAIEFIVCHWIVGNVASADAVFAKSSSQVSAHYAVEGGKRHQYVLEGNTAWHAGNFDVNQRSIGIEHRGAPNIPIDDGTYEESAQLIADICRRYGKRFPLRKHSEFKATQCPGTLDLNRLNRRVDEILNNKGASDVINSDQVKDLYRVFLGREASQGEANSWVGDWAKAFYGIKDSTEGQAYRAKQAAEKAVAEDQKGELVKARAALAEATKALEDERAKASQDSKDLDEASTNAKGLWGFILKLLNRK